MPPQDHASGPWPALPWNEWKDTCETLHMWTQIVGKTRLACAPLENHWWEVPLYVSARGLTTSAVPYSDFIFDIEFDFIKQHLHIRKSSGEESSIPLFARSVADFYAEYIETLRKLGIDVHLYAKPAEVSDAIPFEEDRTHKSYDGEWAKRFWQVLYRVDTVFKRFRAGYLGKSSPVHFFWGSFDLAVTRFSGRPAPPRPGADAITREAYSHEVISCGFWPGNGGFGAPAFYCYASPEPNGWKEQTVRPPAAYYDGTLKEFILKYDDVRASNDPEQALLDFCQSTYESAANLAKWNRDELERKYDAASG
jgi:hypothetical protein